MTLHDKLKQILEKHDKQMFAHDAVGICPDPTDSTISAIIQAVEERLPASHDDQNTMYKTGWNAYREEVRKVLGEIPDSTKGGHTTGPYSIDSST